MHGITVTRRARRHRARVPDLVRNRRGLCVCLLGLSLWRFAGDVWSIGFVVALLFRWSLLALSWCLRWRRWRMVAAVHVWPGVDGAAVRSDTAAIPRRRVQLCMDDDEGGDTVPLVQPFLWAGDYARTGSGMSPRW